MLKVFDLYQESIDPNKNRALEWILIISFHQIYLA